jgi:hypothetical protein
MKIILRIAAAACLLIPLAAQSANIKISSLPFAVTAPGTYVVTGNLTFSSPPDPNGNAVAAITVSTALSGPVVVDLKGFTLTGSAGDAVGVGIGGFGFFANTPVSNTYPITIRNGTLRNFSFGVWAESNTNLSNIIVNNLSFFVSQPPGGNGTGVIFDEVSSSTVNNCIFHGGSTGIQDSRSEGGNSYNNDTFAGMNPLSILAGWSNGGPINLILNHYQFDAPPAK